MNEAESIQPFRPLFERRSPIHHDIQRTHRLLIRGALALATLTHFGSAHPSGPADDGTRPAARAGRLTPPGPLVPLSWLVEHQGDRSLVLVDSREAKAYVAGHLPGAVNIPYASTYSQEPGRETDVAAVHVINDLFSRAGIDHTRTVVVYGDSADYRPAAVVFWVLEVHGHPASAVLHGGVSAWERSRRTLTAEQVHPSPARFVAEFRPERFVDKLEMRRAVSEGSAVILDSRSADEYAGIKAKDGVKRAGHIPTAIHRDAKDLYDEDQGVCSLKDVDTLSGLYQDLKGKRVYTYCNSGRSASLNYLVLRALGANAAVYDGSWLEWSADDHLPIHTGTDPGDPR